MKKLFLLLLCPFAAFSQSSVVEKYSQNIKAEDLKEYLTKLTSDEFEGRETGKKGQQLAGEYIAQHFKANNFPAIINNSYFQQIPLALKKPGGATFTINGVTYVNWKDFYYFPGFDDTAMVVNNIVFAGFGINEKSYNDFTGINATGKALLIMEGEPVNAEGNSLVTGTKTLSEWSAGTNRRKVYNAREIKPSLLLMAVDSIDIKAKKYQHQIQSSSLRLKESKSKGFPTLFISNQMAAAIIGVNDLNEMKNNIGKNGPLSYERKADIKVEVKREGENVFAQNVLGYLEGSDLKNELVVVTAHYDHLGIDGDKIFRGADDDGSGTAAVMELAKAFSIAKKEGHGPRRSMLFMTVAGEEKGLLGSEYYSENPVFPLANTVADLNIDMIGRLDEKHSNNPNYCYIIGSDKLSTELHKINEEANKTFTKLDLDYTFNDPKDPNKFYYRSDHYNFAKHNIPIIFYFNGVHADYHKSTDTIEKINFDKMEKISKLVFDTAWELANRTERIKVDVKNDFKSER